LSDDEDMMNKQDNDFDSNYNNNNIEEEKHLEMPTIYQPKPNYTFHELFQYLL
jgi:hypothetical protein